MHDLVSWRDFKRTYLPTYLPEERAHHVRRCAEAASSASIAAGAAETHAKLALQAFAHGQGGTVGPGQALPPKLNNAMLAREHAAACAQAAARYAHDAAQGQ